jgi:hypothetical protein
VLFVKLGAGAAAGTEVKRSALVAEPQPE